MHWMCQEYRNVLDVLDTYENVLDTIPDSGGRVTCKGIEGGVDSTGGIPEGGLARAAHKD